MFQNDIRSEPLAVLILWLEFAIFEGIKVLLVFALVKQGLVLTF
jgi:hypothetical protein